MLWRELDQVIMVEDNEFSIKSAQIKSREANKKGISVAFDLRNVKDRNRKTEIISLLSTMSRIRR